jgi:hypothetical protein
VDGLYKGAVVVLGAVMAASQFGIDVGAALAGIGVASLAPGLAAQDGPTTHPRSGGSSSRCWRPARPRWTRRIEKSLGRPAASGVGRADGGAAAWIGIGSGSLSFELIRALVERLPAMITPSWDTPTQPIEIEDLVAYLLAALDQ